MTSLKALTQSDARALVIVSPHAGELGEKSLGGVSRINMRACPLFLACFGISAVTRRLHQLPFHGRLRDIFQRPPKRKTRRKGGFVSKKRRASVAWRVIPRHHAFRQSHRNHP